VAVLVVLKMIALVVRRAIGGLGISVVFALGGFLGRGLRFFRGVLGQDSLGGFALRDGNGGLIFLIFFVFFGSCFLMVLFRLGGVGRARSEDQVGGAACGT
jgi:hypothetical protein